eukprot:3725624-Ditylum_brightwellii.AAC.1
MSAGRFKVPQEKRAANDANIDLVFQTKAQKYGEALDDEKRVITEMSEELDDDLFLGDEDHKDYVPVWMFRKIK